MYLLCCVQSLLCLDDGSVSGSLSFISRGVALAILKGILFKTRYDSLANTVNWGRSNSFTRADTTPLSESTEPENLTRSGFRRHRRRLVHTIISRSQYHFHFFDDDDDDDILTIFYEIIFCGTPV